MFIVKVPFEYSNKSGKLIKAQVGDALPDFDEWPHVCKKAHLNLGWIEETKDVEPITVPVKVQFDNKQGKGRNFKK